jgi:hypothetical protein
VLVPAPFKFNTPPLNVPTLATPPTVIVPALINPSVPAPPNTVTPPLTKFTLPFVVTFVVPPLTVPALNAPAFTDPPVIFDVNNPATFTIPSLIPPPLIVALLPNRVLPTPLNPLNVIVPLAAVKYTLSATTFALLTLLKLNPVPLTIAVPLPSTLNPAALL